MKRRNPRRRSTRQMRADQRRELQHRVETLTEQRARQQAAQDLGDSGEVLHCHPAEYEDSYVQETLDWTRYWAAKQPSFLRTRLAQLTTLVLFLFVGVPAVHADVHWSPRRECSWQWTDLSLAKELAATLNLRNALRARQDKAAKRLVRRLDAVLMQYRGSCKTRPGPRIRAYKACDGSTRPCIRKDGSLKHRARARIRVYKKPRLTRTPPYRYDFDR